MNCIAYIPSIACNKGWVNMPRSVAMVPSLSASLAVFDQTSCTTVSMQTAKARPSQTPRGALCPVVGGGAGNMNLNPHLEHMRLIPQSKDDISLNLLCYQNIRMLCSHQRNFKVNPPLHVRIVP